MGGIPQADKLRVDWLSRLVTAPLHPRDARTFRQGARERALEKLVRLRIFVAPVLATLALTFAFFEPTVWRRVVIGAVIATLFALSYGEWLRWRRGARVGAAFNFAIMFCGQLSLIAVSGGLFSPLVPAIVVMGIVSAILLEPRARFAVFAGLAVPAVWLMLAVHVTHGGALIPTMFGDVGELERGPAPWIAALVYTAMIAAILRVSGAMRSTFEQLFADSMRERDRVLDMHAEQSRTLTALSAEIAHELKNPLASVKGLGALVAKGTEGKTAERVAVLRREVDRMQGILEELLTFSRPLVPLSTEEVDAHALADDVVRLHEGFAEERGVRLRHEEAEAAWLRCDPRKVRRVLINLVQNAVDASARGQAVTVSVRDAGDAVVFEVRDRGAGVSGELEGRVFEPGVTSKEHGSGMGLAVARAIARQHGGELTLEDAGDGVRAVLSLPRDVVEEAAQ